MSSGPRDDAGFGIPIRRDPAPHDPAPSESRMYRLSTAVYWTLRAPLVVAAGALLALALVAIL